MTTRMTLLVVVICVLILTLAYPLRLYLQQQSQLNELAAQNAEQRKRVEALKTAVAGYDDPEWTRDEARMRLHFTQPGEKVYLAPAAISPSAAPSAGAAAAGQPATGARTGLGQPDSRQPTQTSLAASR
ncbi:MULTISPECIES: septum formation initiator family protein [unclassified Frankia]|uniref:FtsB family cell division protein n=1 Tax=unclassified Frankia TaxID=2632575 RepID=UPI0027E117DA|nr:MULTISPECIES: septum formation initiator family protein [unclassified Frankia]